MDRPLSTFLKLHSLDTRWRHGQQLQDSGHSGVGSCRHHISGPEPADLDWYSHCMCLSVNKIGGSGGMLPQENFGTLRSLKATFVTLAVQHVFLPMIPHGIMPTWSV